MANKTYNSPLFLTGEMPIQPGNIYIPVSKEGRLGTGQIYDEFRTWFYNPDVQENLKKDYKGLTPDSPTGWPDGFDMAKPSTWESLLE